MVNYVELYHESDNVIRQFFEAIQDKNGNLNFEHQIPEPDEVKCGVRDVSFDMAAFLMALKYKTMEIREVVGTEKYVARMDEETRAEAAAQVESLIERVGLDKVVTETRWLKTNWGGSIIIPKHQRVSPRCFKFYTSSFADGIMNEYARICQADHIMIDWYVDSAKGGFDRIPLSDEPDPLRSIIDGSYWKDKAE